MKVLDCQPFVGYTVIEHLLNEGKASFSFALKLPNNVLNTRSGMKKPFPSGKNGSGKRPENSGVFHHSTQGNLLCRGFHTLLSIYR